MPMRSGASDHTKLVMPKFSLVPDSMASMIRSHAVQLEGIEEKDENQAHTETLSDIGSHFMTGAEEEDDVSKKADMDVSRGHVLLKRSPFVETFDYFSEMTAVRIR
jgi:hypothetical protein